MRLGEIVSGTFDIVRARLRPFLQIAAAYTIAMWVALFIFGLIAVAAIGNLVTSGDIGSSIVGLVIGVLVLIAIGVVAATVAACAYINIARGAENVEGEDVIMGTIDAVRRSLRASPRLLLAMLVLAGLWVAFFIGLFLLTAIVGSVSGGLAALVYLAGIVVAVWLGVSFAFVPQAVVIDEAGPTQALSESMALVQGHWWRTLGYFLVAGLIALGIAIAGGIVSAIVGAITGHIPVVGGLIGALMQSAIFALMYAFYITYGTLMFYDLKARKSGVPEAAALTPGY
jgi:hypothetical protein